MLGQLVDGRYRVVDRIARGGMAGVYRADDLRLDRPVALKVLHPHLADTEAFVTRFRREARSAASLIHPGIVAIYDHGTWRDSPYLVMELVDGPNLRSVLTTRGVPPVGKALDLIAQISAAVGSAHRSQIIHRDLKPENVLVGPEGEVKVADFGLARALTEVTAASSGVVLGTVAYLPPELVADGKADARADVYAIGVMLFELLTGEQPFTGDSAIQIAFQHVHSRVPIPSSRVSWLPESLDTLVGKLTAKDPADRPRDAGTAYALITEVRDGLDATTAGRVPNVAMPVPPLRDQLAVSDVAPRIDPSSPDIAARDASSRTGATSRVPLSERGAPSASVRPAPDAGHSSVRDAETLPPIIPPIIAPKLTGMPAGTGPGENRGDTRALVKPKPKRRWVAPVIALLVLSLAVLGGFLWYSKAGPGSRVAVPEDLIGATSEVATQAIEDLGLTADSEDAYDDLVAAGIVIYANPPSGNIVARDATVKLTVSLGRRQVVIPPAEKLLRVQEYDARVALADAGHDGPVDVSSDWDTDTAAGIVIEVSLKPGETVDHNAAIVLTVSKGAEPVKVPNLAGKTIKQARRELKKLDLTVGSSGEEFSGEVPSGQILSQSPKAGKTLHRGDKVKVVISKGRQPITVPNVIGYSPNDARMTLESQGFRVAQRVILPDGIATLNQVADTEPRAGTTAYRGDTITLLVT